MKNLIPGFDAKEFKGKINRDIADGKRKDTRMFYNEDRIIENFDWLNSERISHALVDFVKRFLEYNKRLEFLFSNSFIIIGSWVNGTARFDSDFDIHILSGKGNFRRDLTEFSKTFSHDFHLIQVERSPQHYLNYIFKINETDNYVITSEYCFSIAFMLCGIPFGKETQKLQRVILDSLLEIKTSAPKKFDTIWRFVELHLATLEGGGKYSSSGQKEYEVNGKYSVLPKSIHSDFNSHLSFEEFIRRFENRCKIANDFCLKNNLELD